MERTVVRTFLYPSFLDPSPTMVLSDQFFSTPLYMAPHQLPSSPYFTSLSTLLQFVPFVVVISLDFSKAFDTIWHSTLLSVQVGWGRPADACLQPAGRLFSGHSHHSDHTVFSGDVSRTRSIIGQHHTGLEHWISRLHCHSSWSQTAQPRQHIHQVRWWHLPRYLYRQ